MILNSGEATAGRVKVSSVRKNDLEEIFSVYRKTCSHLPGHSQTDWVGFVKRFIEPSPSTIFSNRYSVKVVTGKGKNRRIIGFSLVKTAGPKHRRVALIRAFGILERYRKRGIGTLMLRTQIQRIFDNGFVRIKPSGLPDNCTAARRIMENLGAETLGATTSWRKNLSEKIPKPQKSLPPGIILKSIHSQNPSKLHKDFSSFVSDTSIEIGLPDFTELCTKSWNNPISTLAIYEKGTVGMALVEDMAEPDFLAYLAVSKDHRNRGIGTHLVISILRKMEKEGLASARTTAMEENRPMTRILQNLGFERTGTTHYMVIRK